MEGINTKSKRDKNKNTQQQMVCFLTTGETTIPIFHPVQVSKSTHLDIEKSVSARIFISNGKLFSEFDAEV